MTDIITQEDL